ncbi:unnamed protein product [Diatraea saccharalis]|uniref:DUF4781 domain-containing protein n=1 Tax=Diatraea saccharalis TaxID=40085 RepID=A0A9N9WDB4_9NEOP|nr:unnamed protein product [Diatraea saccharalis]
MAANAPLKEQLSAIEIQQDYYEAVGDADWELYEKNDRKYLLQKVAVALCGPPSREGNLSAGDDLILQGYETRETEISTQVFNKICEQAKYSQDNESLYISLIRVVCVMPSESVPFYKITPSDYWVDLHVKKSGVDISIFHVFSLRKCISIKSGAQGCRIFIDHDGRVYQNWQAYLTNNNLPECVMVVPENGQYRGHIESAMFNDDNMEWAEIMPLVKCQVVPSPALGLGAKILSVTDTASTFANIGALLGVAGALLVPAAAPVAVGTAVGVGAVTGVYGIVRSSMNLADRRKHEQSIGIENSAARASWINILVSTAGISASCATKLLSWAAASGTNVVILMNAVRVLQYANLGTGFLGILNSLSDMIMKYTKYNEKPTTLEIFQFTSSALFFGIGAMSNQTAQEIVQDAQAKTINEFRDALPSKVKKKMFDKVTAETRRVKGTIQGNADVIKGLQKIENKNEFFAKIARINKQMNKNKIRISLAPDGNPMINSQHKVGLNNLHKLGRSGRDQLFAKYGPDTLMAKNAPTRLHASTSSSSGPVFSLETDCFIKPQEVIKIGVFIYSLCNSDQDLLYEILSEISRDIHDAFLVFCIDFIASLLPFEINKLSLYDPHYKIRIILFVLNYIKSNIDINDSDRDISFKNVLKTFFKNGKVDANMIRKIKEKLMERVSEKSSTNNDPRKFDDLYNFRKSRNVKFMTLTAGESVKIGNHDVLVKASTIEKLDEWLEMFSQEQCDRYLMICFEIVSLLTTKEIDKLIEINFDEDVLMRVSHYFVATNKQLDLFDILSDDINSDLLSDIALNYKQEIVEWSFFIDVRKYAHCKECSCISFILE